MPPSFLYLVPAVTCVFWIVIYSFMASRTRFYVDFVGLLAISAITFFTIVIFKAGDTATGIISDALAVGCLVFPCIVPSFLMYLRSLRKDTKIPKYVSLWLIIPAVLFAGCLLLDMSVGGENVRTLLTAVRHEGPFKPMPSPGSSLRIYYVWVFIIGVSVLVAEILVLMAHILYQLFKEPRPIAGFTTLFKGGFASISVLQMEVILSYTIFVILGFVMPTWFTTTMLTAHIFVFFYIGLFSVRKKISLVEMKNSFMFNYKKDNKSSAVGTMVSILLDDAGTDALELFRERLSPSSPAEEAVMMADDSVAEDEDNAFVIPALSAKFFNSENQGQFNDESLVARFERLIIKDQLFLSPSLTLVDIAERLNTNKTYISQLVNKTYNVPFPDFVNTLRVDYAENYIIRHRDAKQQEIAKACGFQSASTFNNTFKKITGVTPKIWLATFDGQNARVQEQVAAALANRVPPAEEQGGPEDTTE